MKTNLWDKHLVSERKKLNASRSFFAKYILTLTRKAIMHLSQKLFVFQSVINAMVYKESVTEASGNSA
jgi:hypothetical protein